MAATSIPTDGNPVSIEQQGTSAADTLYASLDFTSPDDYTRLAVSIDETAARLRDLLGRTMGDADRRVLADALSHLDRYAREIAYDWERL